MLMTTRQIIIVLFTILIILAGSFLYMYIQNQRKLNAVRMVQRTRVSNRNYLYNAMRLFSSIPYLKTQLAKIRNKLRNVYPADDITINLQATKIMLRATLISMAAIIILLFASRGDLVFLFMGFTMVYLFFTLMTNSGYSKIEVTLLHQFADFIDGVRENYNRLGRIDDAVGNLLDSLPFEMGLHAEKMHEILTSTHIVENAAEYADISPNHYFTTFMEVASTTMEYGDKRMDNGESMFLRNLNFLKEEINNELLRRQSNAASFAGVAGIAIMPIFFIKPISMYWIKNVPDVASYYNGSYGTIIMVLVFIVSILCYQAIEYLKDNGKSADVKENGISRRVADIRIVKRFVTGIVSRNYSKAVREEEMLRFTGDHLGINAFIVRRYLVALAAGLVMTVVLCTSVVRDRMLLFNDFTTSFQSSIVPNDEYRKIMEDAAYYYVSNYADLYSGDVTAVQKEDLVKNITENTDVHSKRYAETVADEVISRSQRSTTLYFKWWYLFGIFGAAIIGYMAPYWVLLFKQSSVRMDMEDEVSQFQTIVLMLMHVDGVSISMIMEWMERFAFCFKSSISECIYAMPHNGQKALYQLREAESFPSFQSFVNNLLNVDNVGVEKAFSGIEIDREYYKNKRKEDNIIMIQKKSNMATILCFVPLFFILFAYFIFPVAQYAMTQMQMFSVF